MPLALTSSIAGPAALALSSLTLSQIQFIHSLPKAELHAHLNGSIPIDVLQGLAAKYIPPPTSSAATNADAIHVGLQKLREGVRLDEISDFFGLFPAIYALTSTPEALAIVTQAVLLSFLDPQPQSQPQIINSHHVSTKLLSDATGTVHVSAQCTYLELRTTPRQTPHMSRETYLRTVLSTISASNYTPSQVGIIASLDRRMSREDMAEILRVLTKLKREEEELGRYLVGIDLCGDPWAGNVDDFGGFFEQAKECGLGVTVHIAETEKNSPEETLKLLSFNPGRLGHATFLDDKAREIVLGSKTCIEICLTSNLLCKTVSDLESHHIQWLIHHQHPIAICTDDTLPFRTNLTAEYALLYAKPPYGLGLSEDEMRTIAQMSLDSRFCVLGSKT